ncbi:hypothetical protein [Couchioplanes azureus]|uniref:hypothetical protein n=1 Tax=Couchioplanes caeruleus TaxID=56438 RepID=UPI00166FAD1C|nr:hypothetical protein [Couchioplanes caeruleus]GGQ40277.1 hypothetical protein GCM10010166_04130 [Couchioplanes caeruleus subsp. azureus]
MPAGPDLLTLPFAALAVLLYLNASLRRDSDDTGDGPRRRRSDGRIRKRLRADA